MALCACKKVVTRIMKVAKKRKGGEGTWWRPGNVLCEESDKWVMADGPQWLW